MIHPNPSITDIPAGAKLVSVRLPLGPPRPTTYAFVGHVRKIKPNMGLCAGDVPGKVALAIFSEWGDCTVAYFDRNRRPKTGTRVGAHGTWIAMDIVIDPEHTDCELCKLGGNAVDFQLEVERWTVVPPGHDPLFD